MLVSLGQLTEHNFNPGILTVTILRPSETNTTGSCRPCQLETQDYLREESKAYDSWTSSFKRPS